MSDKMRWRYGDTNPMVAAVDPATVIEVGDLLWQDVDDAKPAAMMTSVSYKSPAFHQEKFAPLFLGVAMQRSRSGDTAPIRVATTGVFEFDCPSGTSELGDLIGADPLTHPRVCLANQQVTKVADAKFAIGRVAKFEHQPTTAVLVDIRSTVMTGGILCRS